MRIALIANVQGNLPALRAVLQHIDALPEGVDAVVSAGDNVGLGPNPNEVVDLLRARKIESVRGNYDDAVGHERIGSGVDFATEREEALDRAAVNWTARTLTPGNLEYIRALPRDLRLLPGGVRVRVEKDVPDERMRDYRKNYMMRTLFGGLAGTRQPREPFLRVRVVHGSPRALSEFVREGTALSLLSTIARDAETDVLVSAHAGEEFLREAHGITFVGLPRVSDRLALGRAHYGVLTTSKTASLVGHEVLYDASEYRRALLESGLPSDLLVS